MLVTLLYDFSEVLAYEGLAAGEVDKFQFGQGCEVRGLDFLGLVGRVLPDVAHLASHRAAVSEYYRGVSR